LTGRTLRPVFTVFLSAVLISVLTFDRSAARGEQDPLPVPAAQPPVLDVFGADRTDRLQELRSVREWCVTSDVPSDSRAGPARIYHSEVESGKTDRGIIALEIHVVQDVLAAVGGVDLEVAHCENIPLGPVHAAAWRTLQVEPVG